MLETRENMTDLITEEMLRQVGLTFPSLVHTTQDLSRDEWLEYRKGGVGGSDAAAVLGISPWTSAYSLWAEKTGINEDVKQETDAMRMGNVLEPVVAELFCANEDKQVVDIPAILSHPEHGFMYANVDRFVIDASGQVVALLECKTAGANSASKWADGVPKHYLAQVQHYLAVTNLPKAYLAVLIGGVEYRCYEIERDDIMIDVLLVSEGAFWRRVLDGSAPDVDGSEATIKALRDQWQARVDTAVELPLEVADILAERKEAKEQIASLDGQVADCDARLMALLQENEVGTLDGDVVVTWKSSTRTTIDTKRLKAEKPELAREFERTIMHRPLLIKSVK